MPGQNIEADARPAVAVAADDPLTRDAVAAYLASSRRVRVVAEDRQAEADVVVIISGPVTGRTLSAMSAIARSDAGGPRIVLVADAISEPQIALAVSHGMASLLVRRRTSLDQILTVAVESHEGRSVLPPRAAGALLDRMRSMHGANSGLLPDNLTPREVDVLQLLSEGMDTVEIAAKLNYSERLIKGVIQATVKRLGLRNRTHAVAYAIRMGVL